MPTKTVGRDTDDAQPNEPTQWADTDGDGFGDNLAGVNPDACPNQVGNSTQGNRMGCPDDDGDGWDNVIMNYQPHQHNG